MLTIILGFATSLVYGFADFFGAIASKRIPAVVVTFISGLSGLIFLFTLTPLLGANFTQETMFWGISAGIASAFAMSCLYASLAIGPISIVSPLSAVVSAVVPAAVGFFIGDRFSGLGWIALVMILVAVVLVGFVPGEAVRLPSLRGILLGVGAGAGIGVVLICLDASPHNSGLGSVIMLRAVSASLLGLTMLVRRAQAKAAAKPGLGGIARKLWLAAIVAGIFDSSANVFFLLASRVPGGTLTVVSVLTALYPLGTIVLARVFLKEKIALIQQLGILLALGGSALLAVA
ncbi:MAG: EamA family transporter [Micrococcales bacterium]